MAAVVQIDRKPEEMPTSYVEIDGERYEIPRVDELDLDEEQILYDVAGVIQPDFMPAHPSAPEETRKGVELLMAARIRNPAFKRALVIIAYRRRHPETPFEEIDTRIGRVNAFDAELALYGKSAEADAEDAENPT